MSDREWTAHYQPTRDEVWQGMKLVSRSVYSGGWQVAAFAYSLMRCGGYGVLAFVLSFIVMHLIWGGVAGHPGLYYGLFAVFGLLMLLFQRAVFLRLASAYLAAPIMDGQRIRLDARGILLANGRSESLTDWCDISDLVAGKGIVVAVFGNQGIVIPERLFAAQGGDTGGLRAALDGWFHAARKGRE